MILVRTPRKYWKVKAKWLSNYGNYSTSLLRPEQRKMVLKDKINKLKYNIEDDFHIFLAALQNLLDELKRIDSDINDNIKVGILKRALPENIRFINVF